jgi:hypothetical protein
LGCYPLTKIQGFKFEKLLLSIPQTALFATLFGKACLDVILCPCYTARIMQQSLVDPPDEFESDSDEVEDNRLGPGAVLLILLLVVALLATLIWPVLHQAIYRLNVPPTPTPAFFQTI